MDVAAASITPMAEALVAVFLVATAVSMRPLRCIGAGGPAWIWVATWAVMPMMWCIDRLIGNPTVPLLSLAPLSVLLAGWPLTVVMMVPVALLTGWAGQLDAAEAIHRFVWVGLAPATLALLLGAASRRWLPRHLFVYILVRGFFAIVIALALAGSVGLAVAPRSRLRAASRRATNGSPRCSPPSARPRPAGSWWPRWSRSARRNWPRTRTGCTCRLEGRTQRRTQRDGRNWPADTVSYDP
jgi:hypothetical protein